MRGERWRDIVGRWRTMSQDYIEQHTKEEQRLLWLGVMFGGNYIAHQVNETFDLTYKKGKK